MILGMDFYNVSIWKWFWNVDYISRWRLHLFAIFSIMDDTFPNLHKETFWVSNSLNKLIKSNALYFHFKKNYLKEYIFLFKRIYFLFEKIY